MSKDERKELERRHISEETYHDMRYKDENHYPKHYKYNPTYVIFQKMKQMLGNVEGKHILEYGCGEGWTTAELAALGGEIQSFDISSVAIEHAENLIKSKNLQERCKFRKLSAECLDYPDNSFDIVFGFAILHHLDLHEAIPELFRVMKPGGHAIFAEPLGENPFVNLYRKCTPQYRSADEQPIVFRTFHKHMTKFSRFTHQEFYLTTLFPLALSHISIIPTSLIEAMLRKCMMLDDILFVRCPFLRRFAWYSILYLEK